MLNKKKVLSFGVILGLLTVVYSVVLYIGGLEWLSSFWLAMLLFPLSLTLLFYLTLRIRREDFGGYWTFKDAFITLFLLQVISGLVATLWGLLQYSVIDPSLGEAVAERMIERTIDWMEQANAPEEAREKTLADMASLPEKFKPIGQLTSYVKSFLWFAILSVIGAALVRKKSDAPPKSAVI